MTRITKDKGSLAKDDRIDALALAVHYWKKAMAQDTQKAADQARAEAMEDELKRVRPARPRSAHHGPLIAPQKRVAGGLWPFH